MHMDIFLRDLLILEKQSMVSSSILVRLCLFIFGDKLYNRDQVLWILNTRVNPLNEV